MVGCAAGLMSATHLVCRWGERKVRLTFPVSAKHMSTQQAEHGDPADVLQTWHPLVYML